MEVSESLRKVAVGLRGSADTAKQVSVMKFLSKLARRLGVAEHVYVVGGAVRNWILKRPIKDVDIVIDSVALGGKKNSEWFAKQVVRAIPTLTNITTNQYNVAIITVKGPWILDGVDMKGEVIEIANSRKESYGGAAGQGYKPHMVEDATVEEDIYRREFTFNTLLWRLMDLTNGPEKAEVIDLTGCGIRDLESHTMACPRDPDVVFSDDPTRLLRAIKFVAKYNFKIPKDLAASIKRNAPAMKRAPWEAIATILVENVLNESTARSALKLMKKLGLLDVVAEMVQEQKPFATYLAGQLRKGRDVQLLLDLMDLGLSVKSPISFLTRSQQDRLRELTVPMESDDAQDFLARLTKSGVDNTTFIKEYNLQGRDRSLPVVYAREILLQEPNISLRALNLAVGKLLERL